MVVNKHDHGMQHKLNVDLKNRLQISIYLSRDEPSVLTLYAKSPNLVTSLLS